MESRTNSALFKRAEQLRRWEESETNREPPTVRAGSRRIQFSDGCVFLSACAAGDKEEVVKLIRQGADIDTPNVDGLTALHQACIDDNLDMVEFLVEHGADINRGDHEGWTPLHATASCGFLSIAKYLIEHNADVAAVNNDGELPIDIAETEAMEELLEHETQLRGIDCDAARSQEERQMLADTARWLEGDSTPGRMLLPHPRTGATPLHVAAAKGYIRVMSMLVQGGHDLNVQDLDGWTPLHAAAHWGQREACQLLCENMADMEVRNYVGQTCFDVADPDIIRLLEECKRRQAVILRERPEVNNRGYIKSQSPPKRRSSITRLPQSEKAGIQASAKFADKVPGAVIITSGLPEEEKENNSSATEVPSPAAAPLAVPESLDERPQQSAFTALNTSTTAVTTSVPKDSPTKSGPPSRPPPPPSTDADSLASPPGQASAGQVIETEEGVPSWRRPGSFRSRQAANASNGTSAASNHAPTVKLELSRTASQPLSSASTVSSVNLPSTHSSSNLLAPAANASSAGAPDAEVTLRRAHSFESDERFYSRLLELRRRIKANSRCAGSSLTVSGALGDATNQPDHVRTASPDPDGTANGTGQWEAPIRRAKSSRLASSETPPVEQTTTATLVLSQSNLSTSSASQPAVRRSFVPPVRDEESETQRKAHAKRVRETRRSTQGVTLEEVKTAEQLAKKKQAETSSTTSTDAEQSAPATATTQPGQQPSSEQKSELERRPSWRLCIDDNNKNKFSLEDSRGGVGGGAAGKAPGMTTADTVITIPLRRSKAQEEEMKESSKDATPATIQRRRRPKRRSTGVVQIDMEDIDPSGKDGNSSSRETGDSEPQSDDSESLSDRGSSSRQVSRPSSLGSSVSDVRDDQPHQQQQPTTPISAHPVAAAAAALAAGALTPNGDIDYKKLWEDSQVENERLRDRLRATNEELAKCKDQLENAFQVSNARSAMTEAEKRERRALERKLSEMEEELKQLQKLKSENERLKAENRALTRVVSKLTANASQSASSSK